MVSGEVEGEDAAAAFAAEEEDGVGVAEVDDEEWVDSAAKLELI